MALDRYTDRRTVLTSGTALMLGAALWPTPLRAQINGDKMPIGSFPSRSIDRNDRHRPPDIAAVRQHHPIEPVIDGTAARHGHDFVAIDLVTA